ncbi:hypothetical protein ACJJIP_04640 [Microbulbifer sp. VTAC004]|uniref:hypothetical protein n=1 Tax=unclassified Microbulbifer TaxID=2619833 RepID=UPI004039FB08
MIEDWSELIEIFGENDGSLPDIEIANLTAEEVILGYEILRNHAGCISSENTYYWSVSKQCEVPISLEDNPSELVVSSEAEPFHLCFGNVKSPSGKELPELGLFVFSNSLALDYRMGPEWNQDAIEGLFELISAITKKSQNFEIEHKTNINDHDGSIFKSHWAAYQNA